MLDTNMPKFVIYRGLCSLLIETDWLIVEQEETE